MANPRKFSEKIALHTNRLAEETAAFEQIMKEVSVVKVASPHFDRSARSNNNNKNTLRIATTHQVGGGGGSNALGAFRGGSLPDVTVPRSSDIKVSPPHPSSSRVNDYENSTCDSIKTAVKPNDDPPQSRMTNQSTRQSRTRSPGGPIRSTRDRKPSPYSSGPYLSPPSDTGWRRTNSDSALHQSAMQVGNIERSDPAQRVSWSVLPTVNGPDRSSDGRPRSSCDIHHRVPGIHVYPSAHDPTMPQIPIGNNTGSLPDLTNMDFTSPIHVPLDQDHDSSPYSSSPINTSPSTLSPTSMMPGVRTTHSRFNFPQHLSNHLSVPDSSRYHHHRSLSQNDKNIGIDSTDFTQLGSLTGLYHPPGSPSSSVQLTQIDGYRSPRPSPQPSPTLGTGGGGGGGGGGHSAPCSPGEPSPLSNEYHIHNPNFSNSNFQQDFAQLTVDWAQLVASLVESGCTWSAEIESDTPIGQMYGDQTSSSPQMSQTHASNIPDVTAGDTNYFSTSPSHQLVYPSPSPGGLHNTSPNTPTSVPEIILTDFSAGQDLSRQLDGEFFTEEQLKEGLGSLDLVELQMFNNSVGIPEIVEDFKS